MNLKPLADRIIIKRLEPEKQTAGGLIIPEAAIEKTQYGEVLAVGPSVDPEDIKAGDVVLFQKYSGTEVEDCLIVDEEDVIGVVE